MAIVSSSSLLKVVCPPCRFGNGHFSLLRSVDRGIPKSRATLFKAPPERTARTASRTCSAVKRSRFCDISAWKEAARKKYAVRAAGIFHKIYSRKRNLFSGRSEWRRGMFVGVFLLLVISAVSIFLSRHFFLLKIHYVHIQLQLFLYKIWSDLVGNLLGTEWVSNSSTLSIQGVQFKSLPVSGIWYSFGAWLHTRVDLHR